MRDLLGRLGKQLLVYGGGGAALQLVGLITLPVYARIFDPAQYGMLEVATLGFTVLLLAVDFGMTSAAQRSYYDYEDHQIHERRATLATALGNMVAQGLVVTLVLVAFASPLSRALFGTTEQADLVRIVGVTVPVATLALYLREVMRMYFHAWHYVVSALLGAMGTAAGGIVAVTVLDAGISGVLLGVLIGNGLAALYGLVFAGRDVLGRFSRPELGRMLRYALPLVPAGFGMWGLSFLDRVMLSRLGGFSDTGQYSIGSRYSGVMMFCVATFMTAYIPFTLSLWREDLEAERLVRSRVLTYVVLALVTIGLTMSLFARELTMIIAPKFDRAYIVVGTLCVGVVLYGSASIASLGISLSRRTLYFGAYTAVATGVNIGLNFLLIPAWGMIGAATATTAAYGLLAILYYRKAQQLEHTPYLASRALTALLVGCPLMGIGAVPIEPIGLAIVVKLAVLGVFALIVWRRRVIDEEELQALRGLARHAAVRTRRVV